MTRTLGGYLLSWISVDGSIMAKVTGLGVSRGSRGECGVAGVALRRGSGQGLVSSWPDSVTVSFTTYSISPG